MKRRFFLAPEAARDLVQIWRYLKRESGDNTAFFSVYCYLIVYRPDTRPIEIVRILHGRRDVKALLSKLI